MRQITMIAALSASLALLTLDAGAALAASSAPAKASLARCKDAKGKMIKCPAGTTPTTMPASTPAPAPAKPSLFKSLMTPKPAPTVAPAPATSAKAGPAMMANKPSAPKTPSVSDTDPTGATAKCKDGTYWHGKSHSGSCSHHQGVAAFL